MKKRKISVAVVLAAVAAIATSQLVLAHSRPVRFDPAPGVVVTAAPPQVNGWFDSEIRADPNASFIQVVDSQGNRVDTGTTLSSDRKQMTASLKPGLANGRYTVTYRTWDDDDGAIFGDCYNFYVGQAAADAAQSSGTRLDAGGNCARVDMESGDKTTPPDAAKLNAVATAAAGGSAADFSGEEESGGSSGKVPWWTIVVGVIAGLAIGAAGARMIKTKA